MTDALLLATHLRARSDDALERLLRRRGILPDARIGDFFDLAERLLEPTRVLRALRGTDRPTLTLLTALADGDGPAGTPAAGALLRSFGADEQTVQEAIAAADSADDAVLLVLDGDVATPLDAVTHGIRQLREEGLPATDALCAAPPHTDEDAETAAPPADAAVGAAAFDAVDAVSETITELASSPARELGRGGLSLPDRRRVAEAARIPQADVQTVLSLAEDARLIALDGRTWKPVADALSWRGSPTTDRWCDLATAWRSALTPETRSLLAARPRSPRGAGSALREAVAWSYPADDGSLLLRAEDADARARMLGLSDRLGITRPGRLILGGEDAEAVEAVSAHLPEEISRVYLQDDLTVVSPGPLEPHLDLRLRRVADLEMRSRASTYRFTRAAVARALGAGEDPAGILSFLEEISLTGIPQPVRYLIDDAATRHGAIRVAASPTGAATNIRSDDAQLADTLAVDRSLAPLGLNRVAPGLLSTRFDRDVVLAALQDARYPASAEDAQGRIIPAVTDTTTPLPPRVAPDLSAFVARLRDASAGTPEEPDAAWLTRQLELAVRARSTVTVTVAMPGGETVDLDLEPTGIAGGRLRGRDGAADVERTLPLSSITAVSRAQV